MGDIIELPPEGALQVLVPGGRRYLMGECRIIRSIDAGRLHVSVSCASRFPSWEELTRVRTVLMDSARWVVMVFPPQEHYVNVHPNCFHLWESKDDAGHVIWSEGTGDRPTLRPRRKESPQ